MNLRWELERFLKEYGDPIICEEEAVTLCGVIQPLLNTRETPDGNGDERGFSSGRLYRYIGQKSPAGCPKEGSVLVAGDRRYQAVRGEDVTLSGRVVYRWALLRKLGGEDQND